MNEQGKEEIFTEHAIGHESMLDIVDIMDVEDMVKKPFPFHPTISPRGLNFYDSSVLTAKQQRRLNDFKTDVLRENQKYLAQHPEVQMWQGPLKIDTLKIVQDLILLKTIIFYS